MEGLKPGRIVYYVSPNGTLVPAIVTRVGPEEGVIGLSAFQVGWGQLDPQSSVSYDEAKGPHSWHWMFEGQAARYQPDRVEKT